MTTVTPIQESAQEHLRNALQILDGRYYVSGCTLDRVECDGVERRIRLALDALGEPNAAMIDALRDTLRIYSPLPEKTEAPAEYDRYLRDVAAILLRAQVAGWTP